MVFPPCLMFNVATCVADNFGCGANPHRKSTNFLWNNRRFAPENIVIPHCSRHQRTFQAFRLRRNGIRAALSRFVWSTIHPHTKTAGKWRLRALSGIMPATHPGIQATRHHFATASRNPAQCRRRRFCMVNPCTHIQQSTYKKNGGVMLRTITPPNCKESNFIFLLRFHVPHLRIETFAMWDFPTHRKDTNYLRKQTHHVCLMFEMFNDG